MAVTPEDQWIVWCGTNAEQDAITEQLGDDCISIYGSMTPERKAELEATWREGGARVMVTKPSIFGFGVNWQHCYRMVFVGLSDSYEMYYQAIRRCYRYGQKNVVQVHLVLSELESQIAANVQRKEREAGDVTAALVSEMQRAHAQIAREEA